MYVKDAKHPKGLSLTYTIIRIQCSKPEWDRLLDRNYYHLTIVKYITILLVDSSGTRKREGKEMDELQQKRQQEMLLRTQTYKEALGEDSLIKNMGVMDMDFDAYDYKRLDKDACALFRERLKEMIMIDDIAAEEMKNKYITPNINFL